MKKKVAGLVAVLCLCVMALAACSSGTGTYKFSSMTIPAELTGGEAVTVNVGEEFEGMSLSADSIVLELKKDDKFTMSSPLMGSDEAESGTWKKDGKKITLTVDGESITATLDGKTLTLEIEGMTVVLKK